MLPARPRVVIVLPTYLPESFGGAEQQTRRLAQALTSRGASVALLAPRLKRGTPAREREGAVTVRRFLLSAAPNLGGRHMASFLLWNICIYGWLWRHRSTYDIIHVIHGRLHALPATIAGKRLHKPVLVKPGRGGDAYFDLAAVHRKRLLGSVFARSIAGGTTGWVANSREIMADLLEWGVPRERIHAIPNGVVVPAAGNPPAAGDAVNFVSIGRLDREKAVEQTLRAFAALPDRPVVRLTIVGDGPCRGHLESLTRCLGQEGRVEFRGAVADVRPYLRAADVYLSTSVSEGMSNALLEAMSHGVVPVVSRVSGVADVVEEGRSGLLFPPGDEAAATRRMSEVVTMTKPRRSAMGDAARRTILARYSLDLVATQHLVLYRQVMGAGVWSKA